MKKIHFLLLVATALFTVTTTRAQTTPEETPTAQQQQKRPQTQRKTPEQLAVMQARHIATELAFDEETARKFTEAYCQYQKELRDLKTKAARPRVKSDEEQTEESIAESILAQFDQSRKIVDLREKYYHEYSRFLTQRQIRRIYAIERKWAASMEHLNKAGYRNGTPAGKAAGNRNGQR